MQSAQATMLMIFLSFGATAAITLRAEAESLLSHEEGMSVEADAKIDTYVLNTDARSDRCSCMQTQLHTIANAPQNVFRFAPVASSECGLKDDTVTMTDGRIPEAERSAFCSYMKIWEKASKSDADYIVLFEDDTVVKPEFYATLNEMTKCKNWDYLIVDMHNNGDTLGGAGTNTCGEGKNLFTIPETRDFNYGAHTQIIKKEYLPKLIEKAKEVGAGAPDQWIKHHLPDLNTRAFMWQPRIVTQAGIAYDADFAELKQKCSESVTRSDFYGFREKYDDQWVNGEDAEGNVLDYNPATKESRRQRPGHISLIEADHLHDMRKTRLSAAKLQKIAQAIKTNMEERSTFDEHMKEVQHVMKQNAEEKWFFDEKAGVPTPPMTLQCPAVQKTE